MSIIAKASSGGGGDIFQPAPVGVHRAICCDVVDMGMVVTTWGEKHKVRIVWQLEQTMPDGKPFMVDKRYTLSLDERAVLRKDLESWRSKPFSLTEAAGFDLERLVGVPCVVLIMHKPGNRGDGKVFANVTAVLPKQPGAPLVVRDYTRVIHRATAQSPSQLARTGAMQPTQPIVPSYAPPPTGYLAPAGEQPDPFGPDAEPFTPPTVDDIPF